MSRRRGQKTFSRNPSLAGEAVRGTDSMALAKVAASELSILWHQKCRRVVSGGIRFVVEV
ncbi:hypothetical protein CPB85DRAFT_1335253, partial [Mucidula mucida]